MSKDIHTAVVELFQSNKAEPESALMLINLYTAISKGSEALNSWMNQYPMTTLSNIDLPRFGTPFEYAFSIYQEQKDIDLLHLLSQRLPREEKVNTYHDAMVWVCENNDPDLARLLCTFQDALSEEGKIMDEYPLKYASDLHAHSVVHELLCRSNCTWELARSQLGAKIFDIYAINPFLLQSSVSKIISERMVVLKERAQAATPEKTPSPTSTSTEKTSTLTPASVSPSNEALVRKALRADMPQTLITLFEKLTVTPNKALSEELCLYAEACNSPALIKVLSRVLLKPDEQLRLLQSIGSQNQVTVREIYQRTSLTHDDESTKQIILTCMEWVLFNNDWNFGRDIIADLNEAGSPWFNDCISAVIESGSDTALWALL